MECPDCQSQHICKNGKRRCKQNHICADCGRQFVENPTTERDYSDDVRRLCLKMYANGMGFRVIERVTDIDHTTVISWVKKTGQLLPNAYALDEVPEVGELDEL